MDEFRKEGMGDSKSSSHQGKGSREKNGNEAEMNTAGGGV